MPCRQLALWMLTAARRLRTQKEQFSPGEPKHFEGDEVWAAGGSSHQTRRGVGSGRNCEINTSATEEQRRRKGMGRPRVTATTGVVSRVLRYESSRERDSIGSIEPPFCSCSLNSGPRGSAARSEEMQLLNGQLKWMKLAKPLSPTCG